MEFRRQSLYSSTIEQHVVDSFGALSIACMRQGLPANYRISAVCPFLYVLPPLHRGNKFGVLVQLEHDDRHSSMDISAGFESIEQVLIPAKLSNYPQFDIAKVRIHEHVPRCSHNIPTQFSGYALIRYLLKVRVVGCHTL